jgi:hypothetical protein
MSNNTDKSIEQWLWDAACSIHDAIVAPNTVEVREGLLHTEGKGDSHKEPAWLLSHRK